MAQAELAAGVPHGGTEARQDAAAPPPLRPPAEAVRGAGGTHTSGTPRTSIAVQNTHLKLICR